MVVEKCSLECVLFVRDKYSRRLKTINNRGFQTCCLRNVEMTFGGTVTSTSTFPLPSVSVLLLLSALIKPDGQTEGAEEGRTVLAEVAELTEVTERNR